MSPPASYANGAVLPLVPNDIPPSIYGATCSPSQAPCRSSAGVSTVFVAPSRPPTQPQSSASHSHPGSPQLPGSILRTLSPFTQHALPIAHFQHQHAQRDREMPFRLLIRTTATQITAARSPSAIPRGRMGLHPRGRGKALRPLRLSSAWVGGLRVPVHNLETADVDVGGRARTQRRGRADMIPKGVGVGT
ncbi:hypothetical protein FIBSPDRAFT_261637 [Athelia psychrophila]|uniref:Uncharacterized protein n=1 Tax=Athelia psychrophila TaxID=1759441 RepID=A0A165XGU0_9AGAM|nr:hypothetical protein FIBSPDRAFT_261637 [Fibularhizoctonia sp. CBS 109695]